MQHESLGQQDRKARDSLPSVLYRHPAKMLRLSALCVLFSVLVLDSVLSTDVNLLSQVNKVVSKTNAYMAQNGLSEMPLPEFKDEGSIHELNVYNTKVGNFSSAEVKEVPCINMTTVDGARLYTFEVILGLKPVEINYDFSLGFENVFLPLGGRVHVAAHTNSYQVIGTVLLKTDGTCKAVLESCKFKEMKDFEVNIKPKQISLLKQIKKYLLDVMGPHYLPRINNGLENVVRKPEFQKVFSNIVCSNIQK